MKVDITFMCAVLIAIVKCDKIKRDAGQNVASNIEHLESLDGRQSQREILEMYPDSHDMQLDLERRSRLVRMPAVFGKRSRLDRMPAIFGKRSRLNRMPAIFGKRSRLNRMPAVFGKRSTLERMPSYFGKRSRLNRMPAVFGKRASSLERMPMVFGKRDDSEIDDFNENLVEDKSVTPSSFLDLFHLKRGKLTVEELALLLREEENLLAPLISEFMDKNGDGYISLEELQAVKQNTM